MKVTGFVGSPRKKGNADTLADTFLEGAASAGADVQKFFLADCTIHQCRGCYRSCIVRPGCRCAVFRDDMDMLLDEMAASDLLLFASPLYCGVYTAIMARFFERCLPLWEVEIAGEMGTMDAFRFLNNPVKGKKAVIGLVQDFRDPATAEMALKVFEQNIGRTYMMDIAETLHVTDVRDVGDMARKQDVMDRIYSAGRRLAGT